MGLRLFAEQESCMLCRKELDSNFYAEKYFLGLKDLGFYICCKNCFLTMIHESFNSSGFKIQDVLIINADRVPTKIWELRSLRTLSIINTIVNEVPRNYNLVALELLNLDGNELFELPEIMAKSSQLIQINVTNNFLTAIPKFLSNLPKLDTINLEGNLLGTMDIELLENQIVMVVSMDYNPMDDFSVQLSKKIYELDFTLAS